MSHRDRCDYIARFIVQHAPNLARAIVEGTPLATAAGLFPRKARARTAPDIAGCQECGGSYRPLRSNSRYCSHACKLKVQARNKFKASRRSRERKNNDAA